MNNFSHSRPTKLRNQKS